jgi:cytochrome c oxidase assembly protein subunit 11
MSAPDPGKAGRDHIVAGVLAAVVLLMVGAAYAAVPLYNLFCKTTGFAGTPIRAAEAEAPKAAIDREFEVRFDSNVNGIPWHFVPEARSVKVRAGEVKTVYYRIINQSWNHTVGLASYNVTPEGVAPYFNKIQCFCFSEQTLEPGQQLELPVVFFIDPKVAEKHDLDSISTITLSYTFFPSDKPAAPVAAAEPKEKKPNL